MQEQNRGSEDIAIIGMSGRFPGAKNQAEFWQNLCDGRECITPVSENQIRTGLLNSLGYVPEDLLTQWLQSADYIKAAAALDDIDLFDADFFGYTAAEAALLDPQQRLFLECAWEVMEDAGYDSELYDGLIGVYAGAEMSSYHHNLHTAILPTERDFTTLLGNAGDYLATRVSYKLNCKGPGLTVQSACSTSLVAIHIACQSLRSGECDMALAGGVVAYATQKMGYYYREGSMLSPDGHCRPFDQDAQGTVLAQGGVGAVLLKPLVNAIEDGDHIYAIIKGSAINNDGALKTGYTAPSMRGLTRVFAEALAVADIDPATLGYIEAHGTATPLGDSVEVTALSQVIQQKVSTTQYCALGSLKSNMGHLGVASGIAAIMKTALMLKYKQIPPTLHFQQPNPQIDFAHSPFYVNPMLASWEDAQYPRRAGVNSIGIGGTNAHIVLEEAAIPSPFFPDQTVRPWQLLPFSSKTGNGLDETIERFIAHCKQHPEQNIADIAYTLQVGRRVFAKRKFLLCQRIDDAILSLQSADAQRVFAADQEITTRPVLFLCSAFDRKMLRIYKDLYHHEMVFRNWIDVCLKLLEKRWNVHLSPMLDSIQKISEQPDAVLSFVVSYAHARLWIAWGITPSAVVGIGVGEYVAACLAHVITLEDALCLIVHRKQALKFEHLLQTMTLQPPTLPYLSGMSGEWLQAEEIINPLYWVKHAQQRTIPTTAIVRHLMQRLDMQLLAIGNEQDAILAQLNEAGVMYAINGVPTGQLENDGSYYASLLTTLGQLWLAGVRIDWAGFYDHQRRYRLSLPTYCFNRQRYWVYPVQREQDISVVYGKQEEFILSASEDSKSSPAHRSRSQLAQVYVAPRTEIEQVLAALCQDLFLIDQIGVYDSFYDLGGHSLLAIRLVARIHSAFSLDISLANVFEARNIATLAGLIEDQLIDKVATLSEEEVEHLMQNISHSC